MRRFHLWGLLAGACIEADLGIQGQKERRKEFIAGSSVDLRKARLPQPGSNLLGELTTERYYSHLSEPESIGRLDRGCFLFHFFSFLSFSEAKK